MRKAPPLMRIESRGQGLLLRTPPVGRLFHDSFLAQVREAIAYTSRPLSSKLPFSYQRIPHQIRWMGASAILRLRRLLKDESSFPCWPLDLTLDALADLFLFCSGAPRPAEPQWVAVVLTHDIDTPESLANLPRFLKLEEALGMRSTSFIVPCGWPLDHGILGRMQDAGHEIGLHGYNHDNKTPYLPEKLIRERFDRCADFISRYRVRGYRAPSLLRNERLLRIIGERFAYDSSVPNAGAGYSSRSNGSASARPFRISGVLEIPLTLPTDASLRFMGIPPRGALELWVGCTRAIVRSGGVAVLLTHCEERYSGSRAMLKAYRGFLETLTPKGLPATKTLADVAAAGGDA